MNKREKIILKLIKQCENNGIAFKPEIAMKASLLNIEKDEFQKTIQRLNWLDYVKIFGNRIELTDKGKKFTSSS